MKNEYLQVLRTPGFLSFSGVFIGLVIRSLRHPTESTITLLLTVTAVVVTTAAVVRACYLPEKFRTWQRMIWLLSVLSLFFGGLLIGVSKLSILQIVLGWLLFVFGRTLDLVLKRLVRQSATSDNLARVQ